VQSATMINMIYDELDEIDMTVMRFWIAGLTESSTNLNLCSIDCRSWDRWLHSALTIKPQ
jgi:hypothetical protein